MKVGDTNVARTGCLVIVSGPSGAGKTSICTPALAALENLSLSVSVTTRAPRGTEVDGKDYRFVSDDEFDAMTAAGEFAEWARVHRHRYGTSRVAIDDSLAAGTDLLLDIDVQGAVQIKKVYPEAVSIFLLPPSREHLEQRLRGRGTDDADTVRTRLAAACSEIAALPHYDYMIVNHDLDTAVKEFIAIVHAERSRIVRVEAGDLRSVVEAFDGGTP